MSDVIQDHVRCSICGEITNWVTGEKYAVFESGQCICIDCVKFLAHPERLKVLIDYATQNCSASEAAS